MLSNGAVRNSRVAVVLPGGGARGAYEAGAMSVLLPALAARGERVEIFTGTSVGAINAALLASVSDQPAERGAQALLDCWRGIRKSQVINPIVGPGLLLSLLRFVGEALEIPGIRLPSLLDPSPMSASLDGWIDWEALHRNLRRTGDCVCVVATSLADGQPVGFVHGRRDLPPAHNSQDVRYLPVKLSGEHVRASAAIPLLFPPVEVTAPRRARGFYLDGGTRLNTPIKPALALGADRVIVVGFEPFAHASADAARSAEMPRLADVAANVIDGLLVDQVSEDLRRLVAINTFFADSASSGPSPAARHYRASRGREPYREVSYAVVAPERPGAIGEIANRVFQRRYGGLRGLLRPDYPVLSRLLGGAGRSRGELLSFLLFDAEFAEELITAGSRDAQRWLDRHPGFWCSDAAHDFDVSNPHQAAMREQDTLAEFRELYRR